MRQLSRVMTLFLIATLTLFAGCEGPAGEQGPQGPEGPQGPVGPAGDDGSMIYSGTGAPASNTGSNGDYYINTNTGEMYGPKDDNGWGSNALMVLMGKDGEDGSEIYAGTGAPSSSKGQNGDFYLDKSNYDMYGPKTDQGWGSPINLKGADGNANVTRYIFPGHDFSSQNYHPLNIPVQSETEMKESAWLIYFVGQSSPNVDEAYWSVPGYGKNNQTYYFSQHYYYDSRQEVVFALACDQNAVGEAYDRIEFVQVRANNNENLPKAKPGATIPEDLDTSDYQAIAEYFGFNSK
ncbi:collagen-like protein [Fodinibius halophilus]|uniref:Collagen-like protein n=1 Tax=Fodinibius halophilus TaxID=1736908 RepID=A0A6M1SXV6_9BACT|nr:collagen-like protein [Fodinibius halophilus]NGP88236.1 collagen-like protein [Fodinibius halophilus]